MKANELRIGNLVFVDNGNNIHAVCQIRKDRIQADYIREDTLQPHCSYIEIERVVGIPLTEEWVHLLGFENCCDNGYSIKNVHVTRLITGQIGFKFTSNGAVTWIYYEHVHQLQNLYYTLTGKELTIKDNVAQSI